MKKIIIIFTILTIFCLVLCGCEEVSTVESAIDPIYTQKFNTLLVMFRSSNLRVSQKTEKIIAECLEENKIKTYTSNKLIPFTKQYSQNELASIVKKNVKEKNIDGILFVNIKNAKSENKNTVALPVGSSGGVIAAKLNQISIDIELTLHNTKKGGIAWKGVIKGEDNNYKGEDDLINIMEMAIEKLVIKLKKDKLI